MSTIDRFSLDDLDQLHDLAIATWRSGAHLDWSVPAGTLEWSCYDTAAHAVDTTFAPAMFLASRRQHAYPAFEDVRPLAGATVDDLIDGLVATSTILHAVIATAPPEARAIIRRWPQPQTAGVEDFAPRGALELILHTYDIASGLQVPFEPDRGACARLAGHTQGWWPIESEYQPTGDSWHDLVLRHGRPAGATPA